MNSTLRSGLRKYTALRTQIDACLLGDEGEVFARDFGKCASKRSSRTPKKPGSRVFTLNPKPFDPAAFCGPGWSLWRGPADGDGTSGEEAQDARSLELGQFDMTRMRFEPLLAPEEMQIKGVDKLVRLKAVASLIRLDARLARDLLAEPGHSTLEWLYRNHGVGWMDFMGSELRGPSGGRCVLYLFRGAVARWLWGACWLERVWYRSNPSAVLVP